MSLFGRKDDSVGAQGAPTASPATDPGRADRATRPAAPDGRHTSKGTDMANIGKSITISGDLTGEEDLVIEGKVDGKVTLPNSQLTVGANGTVQAEVQAKSVVVVGRVAGNVRGTERVEIQATGVVEGDVIAPKLIVAEGAVLNGSIQMGNKAAGSPAASPPPAGSEVRKAG